MGLTEFLASHVTTLIGHLGYISVFVFMIMESMVIPIPSEAVMPFAGFLIAEGKFSFSVVIVLSTFGSIIGSLISYYVGSIGGKPFITRYGKFLLINQNDLNKTEQFFKKSGDMTIFVSRFIPVVRHLISLPAGIGKMNLPKFAIFTIIGAGLWNSFLAISGYFLRQNWATIMKYSKMIDVLVIVLLLASVVYFVKNHLQRAKNPAKSTESD